MKKTEPSGGNPAAGATYGERLGRALKLKTTPVLRFAPSPNGELHLGHAWSALINFDVARASGGQFLLRIEDIDLGRRRDAFIDTIFADLAWLGISWPKPVLYQSTRFDAYRAAADKLDAMGLLYPCFATRAEIKAVADVDKRDPDGAPLYPQLHKNLSAEEIQNRKAAGQPYAMRLDMTRAIEMAKLRPAGRRLSFTEIDCNGLASSIAAEPERWGDAVILRKDVPASYHLAVLVDDAYQGVTHVIRGEDLKASTSLHRLLQVLLDLPTPHYHHHVLITDQKGRKLAKSQGAASLATARRNGGSPAEVRRLLATT